MRAHIHSGFDAFVVTVAFAWVGLALLRLLAAELTEHEQTHTLGKALGATL